MHKARVIGLVTVTTVLGDTIDEMDYEVHPAVEIDFNDYRNEAVIARALREIADEIESGTFLAGREIRRTRKVAARVEGHENAGDLDEFLHGDRIIWRDRPGEFIGYINEQRLFAAVALDKEMSPTTVAVHELRKEGDTPKA